MNSLSDLIKRSRLFENIPCDVIEEYIVPRGKTVLFPSNGSLFLPLERVNTVQLLLSGKVKLLYCMENGEQDIKNMLFPGSMIGIDLVCTQTQISPYQAVAAEESEVFRFSSGIILKSGLLPEEHRLNCLNNLLLLLSQINMQNEYRLAILTRNSLRERIMVYLTMQANRNRSDTFTIPFSREEMASFLRVNRSALSHELSLLKQEGMIDFSKNSFSLLRHSHFDYDVAMY